MKKIVSTLVSLAALAAPVVAMGQISNNVPRINTNLLVIGNEIAIGAWIVFTIIAVVMFVIAGILFLTAAGDAEKVQNARNAFLWGVAGIVVGILAYTIITVVTSIIH
jgi:ATP/ADP translocase